MEASEIIEALGDTNAVAGRLSVVPGAVSNMKRRGIPARYWPELARFAAEAEATKGITLDVLEQHTVADRSAAA